MGFLLKAQKHLIIPGVAPWQTAQPEWEEGGGAGEWWIQDCELGGLTRAVGKLLYSRAYKLGIEDQIHLLFDPHC